MDRSTPPYDLQSKKPSLTRSKSARRDKNNQKWEAHKSEIYELYIEENKTLPETISIIEERHGLKARQVPLSLPYSHALFELKCVLTSRAIFSLRKWKGKVKNEWRFEKNVSAKDMQVLVAKAEKRARDEGKETVFWHAGVRIRPERVENFKKRKIVGNGDVASPSAGDSRVPWELLQSNRLSVDRNSRELRIRHPTC